ncbi:MAG: hypothetical protein GY711_30520 [bacterium]|nr:hypothetical protein [bacterium]
MLTFPLLVPALLLAHAAASPQTCDVVVTTAANPIFSYLGRSVAADGDTVLAGAHNDGAAVFFAFDPTSGSWSEGQRITPAIPEPGDGFGFDVELNGTLAIVGAPDSNAATASGGAAYVFRNVGGTWVEEAQLTASDAQLADFFGYSVAIDGDDVIVGALDADTPGASDSGAAYAFRYDSGTGVWSEVQKLVPALSATDDFMGKDVAVFGGLALVGAPGAGDRGAAYAFRRDPSTGAWNAETFALPVPEPHQRYGWGVDLGPGLAAVGAPSFASSAAYVFRQSGPSWQQEFRATAGFDMGRHVAIASDRLVVDADETAYLYDFDPVAGTWGSARPLTPTIPAHHPGYFAEDVALLDNAVIFGSYADRLFLFGGLDQTRVSSPACAPNGVNSTGVSARLTGTGSFVASDNDLTLHACDLPPNVFGYLLASREAGFIAAPGGSQGDLCLGGQIGRLVGQIANSGAFGRFSVAVDLTQVPQPNGTAAVVAGETWGFQGWYRDVNPAPTSNFTCVAEVAYQ